MSEKWKSGLRTTAFITALVVPGGCLALFAYALVRKVRASGRPT